jgi:hypothetical protein
MIPQEMVNALKVRIQVLEAENKGLKQKIKYLELQLEQWKENCMN